MKVETKILISLFFYLNLLNASDVNKVVATINVGVTPHGIAVTPNNKFAYVANNNNYSIAGQDTVSVLNLTNNLLIKTIKHSSFNEPYTVTIDSLGKKVYVTNSNSTTITIIDALSNQVIGVIDGFDGPSGLAINSQTNIGYVNNYGGPEGAQSGNGRTVSIVDLNTNTIIDTIQVDQAPAALAISPDNQFVYVINYVDGNIGTGTLQIIRTSDNTVIERIRGFSGPFAIALTPDGKFAYVTNFGSNNFAPFGTTVSAVDLINRKIVKNITLGIQPSGVAVAPNGKFAYATNYNTLYAGKNFTNLTAGQGTVNIIDTKTNNLIPPTIAVNQSPSQITISPNGLFAYVTNYTSNTVNVIFINQQAGPQPQPNNIDQLSQAIIDKYDCN